MRALRLIALAALVLAPVTVSAAPQPPTSAIYCANAGLTAFGPCGSSGFPLNVTGGGGGSSAPYVATPLGYQQITNLTAATSLTVPTGATFAQIYVEGEGIRYRDDGVAPTATVGQPVSAQTGFQYSGNLANIQFIQQVASATIDVVYYK